jgi:hypothetical protein
MQRFRDLRREWLPDWQLSLVVALGARAFSSITGEVVRACLTVIQPKRPTSGHAYFATNLAEARTPAAKSTALAESPIVRMGQQRMLQGVDAVVHTELVEELPLLQEFAQGLGGITTGDSLRFRRQFWEMPVISWPWRRQQGAPQSTGHYNGRELLLHWPGDDYGPIAEAAAAGRATVAGSGAWGRTKIAVRVAGLDRSLYQGDIYENVAAIVLPHDPGLLPAIYAYVSSEEWLRNVRRVDPRIGVSCNNMVRVPFDVEQWRAAAEEQFPDGLPEPFSDDPSQWLFRGWPVGSTSPLQVALGRLLGFAWPDQEPDVLDELADTDGILCLPAVGGERPAADRLWDVLARAYGEQWSWGVLDGLLSEVGGKPGDLAGWLRDVFFKDHCRVFQNRPFVWHVWDGRRDGFSALVNYHRLDRATLQKLTYSTLGWWIERQRADTESGVVGADLRLAAALDLQRRLALILEGEPPHDIYVRWKSLAEQPIGWDPDHDDGVRLNVRPFVEAQVLRAKFNVHWKKDRGTNPDGSERHNDLHFTNHDKRTASGGQ